MKKISIFTVLLAMLFFMNACQDYYFDEKMDYEFTLPSVKNIEYTLTDADYKTIADSKAAQAFAAKLDAEVGGESTAYAEALALVGANKCFNEKAAAKDYLKFALSKKYPELDKGSFCTVTYNYEESTQGGAPDPSSLTYTGDTINVEAANTELGNLTATAGTTVYVKDGENNKVFYVKGIVTSEKLDVSTQHGNATFTITDGTNNLYCYRLKDVDDEAITDANRLQVGDVVVVKGNLGIYLSNKEGATQSPQLANGSIVSVARTIAKTVVEKTEIYLLADEWIFSVYFNAPILGVGQGDFTIKDVTNNSGSAIWAYDAAYGMKATAYIDGVRYKTESWLITPAINLSDAKKPVLTFDHAQRYAGDFPKECNIYITDNYDGNAINAENWSKIDWLKDKDGNYIVPDGGSWTFMSSGNFDISKFAGKSNVFIAFKYTSDTEKAGTWELKNVLVQEAQ